MRTTAEPLLNCLSRCKPAMGTYVKISVEADESDDELLGYSEAAFAAIARIDRLMSFHNPDSELTRVNQAAHLGPVPISAELWRVLDFALALSRQTGGAFDVTIAAAMARQGRLPRHGEPPEPGGDWRAVILTPGQVHFSRKLWLDLGGIAKGFAVDCALAAVPEACSVVVDAGGDIKMRPWRQRTIGIRVPGRPGVVLPVPMKAAAVASSSADFSEGGHAIVSPATGSPIESALGVSVFAPSCMVADALTKVGFLQPENEALFQAYNAITLTIDDQGAQYWHGEARNG